MLICRQICTTHKAHTEEFTASLQQQQQLLLLATYYCNDNDTSSLRTIFSWLSTTQDEIIRRIQYFLLSYLSKMDRAVPRSEWTAHNYYHDHVLMVQVMIVTLHTVIIIIFQIILT